MLEPKFHVLVKMMKSASTSSMHRPEQ